MRLSKKVNNWDYGGHYMMASRGYNKGKACGQEVICQSLGSFDEVRRRATRPSKVFL